MLVKQLLFSSFVVVHSQQGVVQNLRDLSTDFNNSYMAINNPTFSPTSLPTSQPTQGLVTEKNNEDRVVPLLRQVIEAYNPAKKFPNEALVECSCSSRDYQNQTAGFCFTGQTVSDNLCFQPPPHKQRLFLHPRAKLEPITYDNVTYKLKLLKNIQEESDHFLNRRQAWGLEKMNYYSLGLVLTCKGSVICSRRMVPDDVVGIAFMKRGGEKQTSENFNKKGYTGKLDSFTVYSIDENLKYIPVVVERKLYEKAYSVTAFTTIGSIIFLVGLCLLYKSTKDTNSSSQSDAFVISTEDNQSQNNEEVPQATRVTSTGAFPDNVALSDMVVAESIGVELGTVNP